MALELGVSRQRKYRWSPCTLFIREPHLQVSHLTIVLLLKATKLGCALWIASIHELLFFYEEYSSSPRGGRFVCSDQLKILLNVFSARDPAPTSALDLASVLSSIPPHVSTLDLASFVSTPDPHISQVDLVSVSALDPTFVFSVYISHPVSVRSHVRNAEIHTCVQLCVYTVHASNAHIYTKDVFLHSPLCVFLYI
jgi:hypothetical protein